MKVRIKRQDDRRSAPYWQVFHFRGEGRITVAAILEKLNERVCRKCAEVVQW